MTADTKALRARAVTTCQLDQTNITVDVSELSALLDAADERDALKLELARVRGVLGHIVEIGKRDMTSPKGAAK